MEYLQYAAEIEHIVAKAKVLNLIINGIPSIQGDVFLIQTNSYMVLNLIINGIPSILLLEAL